MSIELWLTFVIASSVLLVIPGPTILTVVSYSIAHGKRAHAPLIAAVALGDTTSLILSVVGLGTILSTSAWLFVAVKWVGGLYLIYLGITLLRSGGSTKNITNSDPEESCWRIFINTWLVTALNPKGIIFFVAFLPQFINQSLETAPQLWILCMTFILLATLNTALYSAFANSARQFLLSLNAQRGFNLTGGSLLTLAGLWALTNKSPAT